MKNWDEVCTDRAVKLKDVQDFLGGWQGGKFRNKYYIKYNWRHNWAQVHHYL
jgi:hypothetical protein